MVFGVAERERERNREERHQIESEGSTEGAIEPVPVRWPQRLQEELALFRFKHRQPPGRPERRP